MAHNNPIFCARVANLIGYGDHLSESDNGRRVLNEFKLSLGGHVVTIKQQPVALLTLSGLWGKPADTSVIEVEGIRSLAEGKILVEDLCWLLSFATHSQVVPYYFCFLDVANRIPVPVGPNNWRPPFLSNGDGEIVNFISQVWARYRDLKEARGLNALFHMVVSSDLPGTILEAQITTCIQCIESVKSYFALVEGARFGITERPSGQFVDCNGRNLTFRTLLELTLNDVGMAMPGALPAIIRLRNALIHRGFIREYDNVTKHIFGSLQANSMHDAMFALMEHMQDLIREYVLRLLGYSGIYWLYSQASRRPASIS